MTTPSASSWKVRTSLPYEAAQYESLAELIKALLVAYPSLSREHIVGHSDVAPGRKTRPG